LRLLFDANLSSKLVGRLAELFPDSVHVFDTGLAQFTSDYAIWEYAKNNGFVIVTADSDFLDIAEERGVPPKVVRLENCNYRATHVEDLLPAERSPDRGIGTFPETSLDYPKHDMKRCRCESLAREHSRTPQLDSLARFIRP
jgi:predicted nuclease of predicted toxin-antitoxin system